MKGLHLIAFILLVIGGLNWLVLALFNWEIGALFGGTDALISRIILYPDRPFRHLARRDPQEGLQNVRWRRRRRNVGSRFLAAKHKNRPSEGPVFDQLLDVRILECL